MMKETLENWLNGLIEKLKQKYNQMGLKASGRWERGLSGDIKEKESGGFTVTLEGEKYTGVLVYGRRPTSPNKRGRLYGIILNWVNQKGIQVDNKKRFAFFVARKIDDVGIKVPNKYNDGSLLSDIDGEIESLKKIIKDNYSVSVYSDVLKQFKNAGN